ncbi:MAG: hypothetical protein GX608_12485 [Lentisphaerae bacterium]|nr:hypothetical protein [Lentisphaerota bacterium]
MAVNIVEKIDRFIGVRHVLASVSDKSGLDTFIPELVRASPDVKIYSTGGTYSAIRKILGADAARRLVQVSDYTGQPEMQGGLVKTLDFKIYLGILGETYNVAHQGDLRRMKAVAFDLVAVNLYPFAQTAASPGATPEQARANIDIGGPCMVRAAAKNFLRVAVVTNPADYSLVLDEMRANNGRLSLEMRFELSRKAFAHTAQYDAAIADYLRKTKFKAVESCYRIQA